MQAIFQLHAVNAIIADNSQILTHKRYIKMRKENSRCSHTSIVEWLRQRILKDKKYKIYEHLEEISELLEKIREVKERYKFSIDPNLPIDLICVEEKKEETEEGKQEKVFDYTIFLVVSTPGIPDSLENRIVFYRFYLSRIISSKRLKIVLVAPDYTKINGKFLQNIKNNGIGFWKFAEKEFEEVFSPMTLREKMVSEFQKSKPENIPLFFDRYVHDAVDAIAGVSPEQFGKRYIDRKVIDRIFDLKNISYSQELFTVVNEQLTEKGDEYEFTNEVFSLLWEKYIGLFYSDFLEVFEPSLQYVFAETREGGKIYRDHYLHQFQVFLLGVSIIDNLYEIFEKKYKNPELSWLIASSFHDIAYPVQLYDDWSEEFFKKVFNIDKSPGTLELKSNFIDQSFLSCMGHLIVSLCRLHLNKKLEANWLSEKNDLVQFFYKEITTAKNHGILSSISLLKMIQFPPNKEKIRKKVKKEFQEVLQNIFVPSALAITLHEREIWSGLKEGRKKDRLPVVLPCLKFEDDPLSFLLIFCDNVQEWGRPSKSQEKEEHEKGKRFYLKEFICDPNGVKITIWTPSYTKREKFFQKKQTELRELQGFLQQTSTIKFTICLRDKDDKGEDFSMEGHPP